MTKIIVIFISAFVITLGILNGRYIVSEIGFGINRYATINTAQAYQLPISGNKSELPLPNQATLFVPRLGISAPIVFSQTADKQTVLKELERGTVHYVHTVKPGETGTSVIWGHSSAYPWYRGGYGSIFALLYKLEKGDEITVRYSDGRQFDFTVKDSLVFNPVKSKDKLDSFAQDSLPGVVLLSCWPVGTDYQRLAVYAEQK